MSVTSQRDRLFDLLADRALVGLDPAEEDELARLLVAFPDAEAIARDIELAAAAISVAAVSEQGIERMPRSLSAKLEELAQDGMPTAIHRGPELLASARSALRHGDEPTVEKPNPLKQTLPLAARPSPPAPAPLDRTLLHPQPPQQPQPTRSVPVQLPAPPPAQVIPFRPAPGLEPSTGRFVMLAGWVAAAACLLLAAGAWYFRPRTQIVTVDVPAPPPTASTTPPMPTPQEERDALLARAGTARLEWTKNAKDPASKQASGDVVWNAAEQRGFMRFRGLAKNDKRGSVYQLWIFDKGRDDKYPVDGGVFDVDDETGDVIVPIQAKLPVGEVALFAVTVEKPGGVVVSKRERIVVTAKPTT